MKNQFNEALISYVKKNIPKGEIINMLMDTLGIGKEAAYRRMRGDVLFTFDEVARISLRLGVSLDNIIGIKHDERAVFDLKLYQAADNKSFIESYCKMLEGYVENYHIMGKASYSKSVLAFNTLPYILYTPYTNILKFRIFRWMHQSMGINAPQSFSGIALSKELLDIQKKYITDGYDIQKTHIILDNNAFLSFVIDLEYFYKLNLITDQELELLKKEFLELLDEVEQLTNKGVNKKGNEILIYISNLNFDACYSYYEWDTFSLSHVRMYSINSICSQDTVVCREQKEWIESLKRYSVLITQSGEIQKNEYFKKQRSYVNNISI